MLKQIYNVHAVSITGFARQLDDNVDSINVRYFKYNQNTTIFTVGDNMMTGTTQHCYYS